LSAKLGKMAFAGAVDQSWVAELWPPFGSRILSSAATRAERGARLCCLDLGRRTGILYNKERGG